MPDKREVGGSSPLEPTNKLNKENTMWGCSSAGRAPALQAGGQEFDSPHLHHEHQKMFIMKIVN